MTDHPMRVAIIYLVYDNRDIDGGIALLTSIVQRTFGLCTVMTTVVDNMQTASDIGRRWHDGRLLVSGDNRLHEFSGWERGYAIACDAFDLTDSDLVLFANDTFARQAHQGYLDALGPQLVRGRDLRHASIGFCDDFPQETRLLDLPHRWWFRSNIFIHPKATVDRLWPLRFPLDHSELFSDADGRFWSDTDLVSDNWKAYVSCWLFGTLDPRYPEYRLVWHRAAPLTAANKAAFQVKALCMLSEHYMGARLANWQIPIIDFNRGERTRDRHLGNYAQQFLAQGALSA